jgi:ATP-dependent RNA helicase SUPV3L1/SUV3
LMQPIFAPVKAVAGLEGDALREIATRAEGWIAAQLAKAMGGIVGLQELAQQPDIDGNVRALAVRLADEGGIAGRHYLADAIAALPKDARGAARKGGIVFGALDIYHHAALKPAAAKWRAALFAARDGRAMPELPPESAVHLKDWKFAHPGEARNAGYRRIGDEYVRIDLAERVIKKAHEARGQGNLFGMDMAFATSLGISEAGLKALMRDAGFRPADAPVLEVEEENSPPPSTRSGEREVAEAPVTEGEETSHVPLDHPPAADGPPPRAGEDAPQAIQPAILTYWRWIGLPKPRTDDRRPQQKRPQQHRTNADAKPRDRAQPTKPDKPQTPAQPSSLALQLAALQGKFGKG